MSYLDEFLQKYHAPSVNNITVGFSGIDPSPITNSTPSLTNDEILELIEQYISSLKIRVDSGDVENTGSSSSGEGSYLTKETLFELIGRACDGKCKEHCSFYGGHWFKYFAEPKTWHEAKAACEAMGGHLATSTSPEKNEFLADLVGNAVAQLGGNAQVWLGATDEEQEGVWKWVTGEEWSYTNWRAGQPDNAGGKEHYLHFNWGERGKWNDYLPTVKLGYICECDAVHEILPDLFGGDADGHYHLTASELEKLYKLIDALIPDDDVVLPGTDDHEELSNLLGGDASGHYHLTNYEFRKLSEMLGRTCDGNCQNGCSYYDGHWFKYYDELKTWAEAKAACEAMGGHLATSTSAEKNNFLVKISGGAQVWLGATDEETEGTWKWVTGEDWDYTNWNTGEPNNSGGAEHYLQMSFGSSGKWNDLSATSRLGYICECDAIHHEALPDLLGGNRSGHYHLTDKEKRSLDVLINTLMPAGVVVIPPSGTDDHEELNNLHGGDGTGHYHFTADEWQKIKTLITTTFPPGSSTPVFPGTPTDPDIPDVPLPDYSAMFAGKEPQWGKNSIPGKYKSAPDGGRMYSGPIAITASPYTETALVMPMTYNGSTTKIRLMYTKDLVSWTQLKEKAIETYGSSLGEIVYGHVSPTSKLKPKNAHKADFMFLLTYSGSKKVIWYRHAGKGDAHYPGTKASGYLAGDYSPDGRKFVASNGDGNIAIVAYKKDTSTAVSLEVADKTSTIGMSVNPGCLKYGKGIFCATGPNGTAQSADGANWTVNNTAPQDMIGLEYREDWTYTDSSGASFTGAFLACSRATRVFYYSGDGKDWTQCSTTRIPLESVSGVAYSPERQEYCAVGTPGNVACISKDFVTWTPTYVSVADLTAIDVVWASFAGKFVLMPNNSNDFYTYPK